MGINRRIAIIFAVLVLIGGIFTIVINAPILFFPLSQQVYPISVQDVPIPESPSSISGENTNVPYPKRFINGSFIDGKARETQYYTAKSTIADIFSVVATPFPSVLPASRAHFSAINNGLRSHEPNATVITAFFPIDGGKHPPEYFVQWYTRFLSVRTHLVIFTTPTLKDVFLKLRKQLPTVIYTADSLWDFEEVKKWKNLYTSIEFRSKDREMGHHAPELYAIWNLKSGLGTFVIICVFNFLIL